MDEPQSALVKFGKVLGDCLRAVTVANPQYTEAQFFTEVDLATKNEVPAFLPGEVPSYVFVTQAAQEFLDERQKCLDAYAAWKRAGSVLVLSPYWETRG